MSQHRTEIYYSLVEEIIADQQRVWGDQSLEIADSVSGLHVSKPVSDSGDIWVNGDGKEIAGALVEAYIDRFGEAAAAASRDVADGYRQEVDLPSTLRD